MFWLIEPFRDVEPLLHTSSLDHRPKFVNMQVNQTIEAFEHFVYHYSNKELIFADLQCLCFPVFTFKLQAYGFHAA